MKNAFSLVELSIVLVILGLLTGGILAGQNLIRAAELRSVSTEYSRYVSAVNSFRDKYFAIPGDFRDATKFWGTAASGATCITTSSSTSVTCDGDGDGKINPTWDTTATASNEGYRFWQHLANAGLVEGSYTGISEGGSNSYTAITGVNVPRSKLSSAGWTIRSIATGTYAGDPITYALEYGNAFRFGRDRTNANTLGQVLTPEEAWNIDTKMDDGLPAQGKVIAAYWNNACSAADDGSHTSSDLVASYRLSDSAVQCALYFRKAF